MNRLLALMSPRQGLTLVGFCCLALVTASLILTKLLALAPCPLCIFQRMLLLLLALLVLVAAAWPRSLRWTGILALLTGLGGLATAAYQSWIQMFPPVSLSCGASGAGPIETLVQWAGSQAPWLFSAWGECTSPEWSMLGLSLANWSLIAFAVFSFLVAFFMREHALVRIE